MSARSLAVALAFASLAWCATAHAQEVDGSPLVQYPSQPDAVQTMVLTARPHTTARGDLTLTIRTTWPSGEARVRQTVSLGAGATRSFLTPAPVGPYDSGEVTLEEPAAVNHILFAGGGSSGTNLTYIGVLGLGGRVTAAIQSINPEATSQARVAAGPMLTDPTSGDAIVPALPSAFSGAHAIVAGSAAILALPPESRRTLRQWVIAGGFLAVSPRTVADLRDPWFVDLFGRVTDDGNGRLSGPQLLARRWGAAVHLGLGVAGVIPYDLSAEGWAHEPLADAALRDFVDFTEGAGGGMVAPGELSLYRRFARPADGDAVSRVFRPKADVRGLLIPVTILLTLYIVGVGVALARNRKSRAPLGIFVRLPLVAFVVLGIIVAAARLTRSSASTARVLAVYDLGGASNEAIERVFVGLNAGAASTFAVAPPSEGLALYSNGASSGSTAMRWDGRRLSVERVRLGLWETGLAYTERMVDAGSGVTVVIDGAEVRVTNRSPWTLTAMALVRQGAVAARFGGLAPGGTAHARLETSYESVSYATMFPRARGTLDRVFVDHMMGTATKARGALQLFALATVTDETRRWTRGLGFAPGETGALLRVVIPEAANDPDRVGAYSARLDTRRSDFDDDEGATSAPATTSSDDAGADVDEAGTGGAL